MPSNLFRVADEKFNNEYLAKSLSTIAAHSHKANTQQPANVSV